MKKSNRAHLTSGIQAVTRFDRLTFASSNERFRSDGDPVVSRRQLLEMLGVLTLAPWGTAWARGGSTEEKLRVVAYNVFGGQGWPKDRPRAQAMLAQGKTATMFAEALRPLQPDIINFSEAPSEDLVCAIADLLEMKYVYFPSAGEWPGALLTRFQILDSQNLPIPGERNPAHFTRHWGKATLQLSTQATLIVHSAHLFPTENATPRLAEIDTILWSTEDDRRAGHSLLLLGDLNFGPDSKEYQRWIQAGWVDTFARAGKGKSEGEGNTYRADIPRWRVDYVWAAGPLADEVLESRPLFQYPFRLSLTDAESIALSDHLPQLAVFRWPR